jgi:hypothetical protein
LAARVGNDDTIFSSADEATLAKLNADLEDAGTGMFAPTSPKRATPTTPKTAREKSKEELLDDLRQVAPARGLAEAAALTVSPPRRPRSGPNEEMPWTRLSVPFGAC